MHFLIFILYILIHIHVCISWVDIMLTLQRKCITLKKQSINFVEKINHQKVFCIILRGNLRFIVINVFTSCTCIDCEVHSHLQIISSSVQQDWFSNHITRHDEGLKHGSVCCQADFILFSLSIFLSLFHSFSNYTEIINFCKIYIQIEIHLVFKLNT